MSAPPKLTAWIPGNWSGDLCRFWTLSCEVRATASSTWAIIGVILLLRGPQAVFVSDFQAVDRLDVSDVYDDLDLFLTFINYF